MYDLKVDAPSEIRGEFSPIETNVPGIQICEHLPRLAKITDKLAIIRSMVGAKDRHESFQCMTGRLNERNPPGGWPEFGSVISKIQGSKDPTWQHMSICRPKCGILLTTLEKQASLDSLIHRSIHWATSRKI